MLFYETSAAVIPVLLLALVFDSKYLENYKNPGEGNKRWSRRRVIAVGVLVCAATLLGEVVAFVVLAGAVDSGAWAKWVIGSAGAALLVTLLVRVILDIIERTR